MQDSFVCDLPLSSTNYLCQAVAVPVQKIKHALRSLYHKIAPVPYEAWMQMSFEITLAASCTFASSFDTTSSPTSAQYFCRSAVQVLKFVLKVLQTSKSISKLSLMASMRLGTLVYNVLNIARLVKRTANNSKLLKTFKELKTLKTLTHQLNTLWKLKDPASFDVWRQIVQSFEQASRRRSAYAKACEALATSKKGLDRVYLAQTNVNADACMLQKLLNQNKTENLKTRIQVEHARCVLKCLPATLRNKLDSIQQEKLLLQHQASAVDIKVKAANLDTTQALYALEKTLKVHQDAKASLCRACQELSIVCSAVSKRLHEQSKVDDFMRCNKYPY